MLGKLQLNTFTIILINAAFGAIVLIGLSLFMFIILKIYKQYPFKPFFIKLLETLLGIFYIIFNLLALFSPSIFLSTVFYSCSIISLMTVLALEALFLRILKRSTISLHYLILLSCIPIFKLILLVLHPINVFRIDNIFIREAHLQFFSVFLTDITILIIFYEFISLVRGLMEISSKRSYAIKLLLIYSLMLVFIPAFEYSKQYELLAIALPYIEGAAAEIAFFGIVLLFRKNPDRMLLLPIKVYGFLMHTYGGLPLIRKAFRNDYERAITLSSSLVASIISLEKAVEYGKKEDLFRPHKLINITILMYFGEFVVGTFISNDDNIVLREILKSIVDEFEKTIGYIDEGMVTDRDTRIAEDVLSKYIVILL